MDSLNHKPLGYRINILIARLCFRGISFPQMGRFAWVKTILENWRTILRLIRQGFGPGLDAAVPSVATEPVTKRRIEAIASARTRRLSAPRQALVSFEDIELGDHGVEAGGAVLLHSC